MSRINSSDVAHLGKLASLKLTAKETAKYAKELGRIIDYIESLSEVATEGVEPTSQTTGLVNSLRSDKINPTRILSGEEATSGTENTHNNYFVVGRVLAKSDE